MDSIQIKPFSVHTMERQNTLLFQLDDPAFFNAIFHIRFPKNVTSQFHRHFKDNLFKISQMVLRDFDQ